MEVRVKARTGAKKEGVRKLPDGRLEISVKPKPEAGAANARIVELAAEHFGVSISRVKITRGKSSPWKTLSIAERG